MGLIIFMALLVPILRWLSNHQAFYSKSMKDRSVMVKFFSFQIINVLLIYTVSGTLFKVLSLLINQPGQVIFLLANSLPAQAPNLINYIMLSALGKSFLFELLRPIDVLIKVITAKFFCKSPRGKLIIHLSVIYLSDIVRTPFLSDHRLYFDCSIRLPGSKSTRTLLLRWRLWNSFAYLLYYDNLFHNLPADITLWVNLFRIEPLRGKIQFDLRTQTTLSIGWNLLVRITCNINDKNNNQVVLPPKENHNINMYFL